MDEPRPPRKAEPRPPLWTVSVAVAAILVVVLGVAELLFAGLVFGVLGAGRDPHGYVSIFAFAPMVLLLPPVVFAVLGFVGLVRDRGYGYVLTAVASIWVTVPALLGLVGSAAGNASPLFALALFVVLVGGSGVVVTLLGWRSRRGEPPRAG